MADPVKCAKQIIVNDRSELAPLLLDLLLCAVEPGFKESNEFDEILDLLYVPADEYRDGRERYIEQRKPHVTF